MEYFVETVNGFWTLTIFEKRTILVFYRVLLQDTNIFDRAFFRLQLTAEK